MRQILKSYLKSYFKNWIEAVGLILFIVIIIATVAGVISGSVQYRLKYNDLVRVSQTWDYYFLGAHSSNNYKKDFLVDYYINNKFVDKNNNVIQVTSTIQPLLDKNSSWWGTINAVCSQRPNEAGKEICYAQEISKKLNEISEKRENGHSITGLNPLFDTIGYFKTFNYNYNMELATRLFKTSDSVGWSASFNENQMITQQVGKNYTLSIVQVEPTNLVPTIPINFNQLRLYAGVKPQKDNEVVISSLFAQENNVHIGDEFALIPNNSAFNVKIVGIGNTLDSFVRPTSAGLSPNLGNDRNKYGIIYATNSLFYQIQNANAKGQLLDVKYKKSQKSFLKMESSNAIINLKENLLQAYNNSSATLLAYSDGYVATQTQNVSIQIILYSIIGVVLLVLGFIFINYTMKKEMNKTRRQIGIFKAFGYSISELSWIFSLKFFITMIGGIAIGYCLSIPIQMYVNTLYIGLLIPFSLIYAPWQLMLILFLVVPITFTMLSYLFTFIYIKKSSLDLINGAGKVRFTAFNDWIKHFFSKTNFIFRIQLAFTLKSLAKWLIVMFIFFVSSLLFIIQFNASDIFSSMVNSLTAIYQPDVDHEFRFPNMLDAHAANPTAGDKLQLTNNNYFEAIHTTNVEELAQESLIEFNKIATTIRNIKNNGDILYCLVGKQILEQYVPGGKSIYLDDLSQVIQDLNSCSSSQIPAWLRNIGNLKTLIDQSTVRTVISFSRIYYNRKTEVPIIWLKVSSSSNEITVINDTNLRGIDRYSWANYFQMKNVNRNVVNSIFDEPISRWEIPAIISEKMSKLAKLDVGDVYEFAVNNTTVTYNLSIKVKAIIKNDTTRRNIFVNSAAIRDLFVDFSGNPLKNDFYNGIISKEPLIRQKINPKDIILGKENYKISLQNFTINIFNHGINDHIDKILQTVTADGSDILIFTGLNQVEPIALQKILAKEGLKLLNNSLLILQFLNGAIIFIILAVITSSVIDEASQIILMMRAMGYKPRQINFIVIGNYVIGIIFVYVIAYLLTLLLWYFAVDIILTKFQFVINIPFNWQTPLKSGGIIGLILFGSWLLSMHLVKKRKLNELTE